MLEINKDKTEFIVFSPKYLQIIHEYINDEICKTLVQALISYQLDYHKTMLHNIPLSLRNRLLLVQNYVAHVVTGTRKIEPITPVLFQLHCLPVGFT